MLPHSSPTAATNLLLATTPELLVWPRLPRRSGRDADARQRMAGFPGLVSDGNGEPLYVNHDSAMEGVDRLALAYLRSDLAAGMSPPDQLAELAEFMRSTGQGQRSRALVCEALGPVSMALTLTDEHDRPLIYTPELCETVVHHIALRVGWQVAQLQAYCAEVVICLDEPMLDALDLPFCPLERNEGLGMLARVFETIEGVRALALSSLVDWATMSELAIDLVFCDAYEHGAALVATAEGVGRFLEQGGSIAWGVVPADAAQLDTENVLSCLARFRQLLTGLEQRGLDHELLLQTALISTSDGLAQLSPTQAEHALYLCAGVAAKLREQYQL
jgi:hypothetical protein